MSERISEFSKIDDLVVKIIDQVHVDAESEQVAKELEQRAQRLRDSRKGAVDTEIAKSAKQLFEMYENDEFDDREATIAAIRLAQHKPSGIMWSGAPDEQRSMEAYDFIIPGTVLLQGGTYGRNEPLSAAKITSEPSVQLREAQGMGGLPEAIVTFSHVPLIYAKGLHRPTFGDNESTSNISTLHSLHKTIIGKDRIQAYYDDLKAQQAHYTCRHGDYNVDFLQSSQRTARSLSKAAALSLNLGHLHRETSIAVDRQRYLTESRGRTHATSQGHARFY